MNTIQLLDDNTIYLQDANTIWLELPGDQSGVEPNAESTVLGGDDAGKEITGSSGVE